MAPVIAQMSPASQGEGQLLKHPLISVAPYRPSAAHPLRNAHKARIYRTEDFTKAILGKLFRELCNAWCSMGADAAKEKGLNVSLEESVQREAHPPRRHIANAL